MKNIKGLSLILALIMLAGCVLSSCGGTDYKALKIDPNYVSTRAESTTRTINGVDGIKVSVPKKVNSVVCFSREAATVMREIGQANVIKAGDDRLSEVIVGVKEVKLEEIASMNPDVVFITDNYDTSVLDNAGVTYLTIPEVMTVNDIKTMIKMIEKIFEITTESLSANIDNEMTLAHQTTSTLKNKFPAFIDMGDFKTSGKGTYVNEILSAAGCENVFYDREGFIDVSAEEIIEANPSIIFTTDKRLYTRNNDFASIDAVKNNRVFEIDERDIEFGSQYIADALSSMFNDVSTVLTSKK